MRYIIVPVIAAVLIFQSCSTYITLTRTYPPEIIPARKPVRMAFINNFDYTNDSIVADRESVTYAQAVSSFTKGLLVAPAPSDSIEIVTGDTLLHLTGAGMLTTLLPVETIRRYCDSLNASMLISIDSVNIGFTTNADYIQTVALINFYSRNIFLYSEFFVSVYDTAGNLLNRSSVGREIKYSSRVGITSDVIFAPTVANAARKINLVAEPCGEDFMSKFQTITDTFDRKVYTGKGLEGPVKMMRAGHWDAAVKALETISAASSGTKAKRAKADLEVAKEGAGNSEQ